MTWLRSQGSVKDQGGNLRAMGIDNAPRDLDFARGEQRFGRLIDDANGMTLDDAAMQAWEAGYLPGHDRPDINTLLDAIDRTHSGMERYYHPNDLPEVEQFHGMRADRHALEEQLAQGPDYNDRSVAAREGLFYLLGKPQRCPTAPQIAYARGMEPKPIHPIEYWIATVFVAGSFVAGIIAGARSLLS